MNFDLRRPCPKCPFVQGNAYLRGGRAEEIAVALLTGATFSCHQTNSFEEDEEGFTITVETAESQHCAGALIMLERAERPNQLMRWMERLRFYDQTKLDMAAPVYANFAAFIAANGGDVSMVADLEEDEER